MKPIFVVFGLSILTPGGVSAQHAGHGATGAVMYHSPQWSPDGKWILVSANREHDGEIYLVRADGGEIRQLTHNDVDDIGRWSDDGPRVLFESSQPGGVSKWFSMKSDGSDVRPYMPDSVISRSPDAKTLLFESVRNGRGRLFLMTSARTNAREIATARHAEQGAFSPDGKSIVFEQRSSMHDDIPHSQIVVSRPDGSAPRVVAVFMRDGKDGGADIWIMNSDASGQTCISCRLPKPARQ
jgi:Tol biopolymer transport system component